MFRARGSLLATVAAVALFAMVGLEGVALGATPTPLVVPQSTAFSVLGRSCGGIQEHAFATGFDAASGYPAGDVYLSTRCGGSGRGGGYHTTTYSAWIGAIWDLTGALVSHGALSAVPTVDPAFSAFDQYGNEVINQSNSAFLVLAPGFVPAPRVVSVAPTVGPAAGGTILTIIGTGFTGATAVNFGGAASASFTVNGDTSITTVSPTTSGGTVDVTVATAGGASASTPSDQFTFVSAPTVSGISPASGPLSGGTQVTITGADFLGASAVYFGVDPAGFTVDDASSITAISPVSDEADTLDVTVVTAGGVSAATTADQFAYSNAPVSGPPSCGIGPELAVVLLGLRAARARWRGRGA